MQRTYKKDRYLLKGRIIATEVIDGKKKLLTENKDINEKLKKYQREN